MNHQELLRLLDKYLKGSASKAEEALLFEYYESFQQTGEWNEAELGSSRLVEQQILERINAAIENRQSAKVVPFYKRTWIKVAAASVLLFLLGGLAWQAFNKEAKSSITAASEKAIIQQPDATKITLTLSNGTIVLLDSTANGILLRQGNTVVRKNGRKLIYEVKNRPGTNQNPALAYHKITTPRGARFEVALPDGSRVWLNAASSIRFPIDFGKSERKTEISGEVYFEVAKEKFRPFRVYTFSGVHDRKEGTVVEVLGTQFNINAYKDESATKTTLLEGSVKVAPVQDAGVEAENTKVLLPGQQAQTATAASKQRGIQVSTVDVSEVTAWKQNLFNFNTADTKTIMRQLARWYNVEIGYEGKVSARSFSGTISRDTELATVLRILEQSGIRFRVEGKKIIVRP